MADDKTETKDKLTKPASQTTQASEQDTAQASEKSEVQPGAKETGKTASAKAPAKKAVTKKAAAKKAAVKKAAARKSTPRKATTSKSSAASPSAEKAATPADTTVLPVVETLVAQMNAEREVRDRQISSLIEEVRGGLAALDDKTRQQAESHEKEMGGLYRSLQDTFTRIKDDSDESESLNLNIFKTLSDSIMQDHEKTLLEIQEQGRLQDKKIEHMAKMLEQRTIRNRLIAIPGVLIAIVGIFYMFYVVSIMESAMTSMSQDMHQIQASVGGMAGEVKTISTQTAAMNKNMVQLNANMGRMSQDLNVMNRNVSPAMRGMNDMMPWR